MSNDAQTVDLHYEDRRDLPAFIAEALSRRFGETAHPMPSNIVTGDLTFQIGERISGRSVIVETECGYGCCPEVVEYKTGPAVEPRWFSISAGILRDIEDEISETVPSLRSLGLAGMSQLVTDLVSDTPGVRAQMRDRQARADRSVRAIVDKWLRGAAKAG